MRRILLLYGSDSGFRISRGQSGLRGLGHADLLRHLDPERLSWRLLFIVPPLGAQRLALDLGPFDGIVNAMADADLQLRALAVAGDLCDASGLPIINHPVRIGNTQRNRVYELLHQIPGMVVPRTVRITPPGGEAMLDAARDHGLRYPLLVRPCGTQSGWGLRLVGGEHELADYAARAVRREHYMTEYVEHRSSDGFYRKARVLVFRGQAMVRDLTISDTWEVRGEARARVMVPHPELVAEARAFIENDPLTPTQHATLAQAARIVGLEHFALDCHLLPDGRILVFELGPAMQLDNPPNVLPSPAFDDFRHRVDRIRERLHERLFGIAPQAASGH